MARKKTQSTDSGTKQPVRSRQKFTDLSPMERLLEVSEMLKQEEQDSVFPALQFKNKLNDEEYKEYEAQAARIKANKKPNKAITQYVDSVNALKKAIQDYAAKATAVNMNDGAVDQMNKKANSTLFDEVLENIAMPKEGGKNVAQLQREYLKNVQKRIATEIANS